MRFPTINSTVLEMRYILMLLLMCFKTNESSALYMYANVLHARSRSLGTCLLLIWPRSRRFRRIRKNAFVLYVKLRQICRGSASFQEYGGWKWLGPSTKSTPGIRGKSLRVNLVQRCVSRWAGSPSGTLSSLAKISRNRVGLWYLQPLTEIADCASSLASITRRHPGHNSRDVPIELGEIGC